MIAMVNARQIALVVGGLVLACGGSTDLPDAATTAQVATTSVPTSTSEVTTTPPSVCDDSVRSAFEGVENTFDITVKLLDSMDDASEADLRTEARLALAASNAADGLLASAGDRDLVQLAAAVATFYEAAAETLEEAADRLDTGSVADAKLAILTFSFQNLEEFMDLDARAKAWVVANCDG
jgi:hypothetical protein